MHKELESTGQVATEACVKILPQNNPVMTEENHRSVSDLVGDISVGIQLEVGM
jgi:hypothetical protein